MILSTKIITFGKNIKKLPMKKLIYCVAVSVFILSCTKEQQPDYVLLSGKLENSTVKKINISGNTMTGNQYYRYEVYLISDINAGSGFAGCVSYLTRMSIDHLLIECPKYSNERKLLAEACQLAGLPLTVENILGSNALSVAVIAYLKATNYLGKL